MPKLKDERIRSGKLNRNREIKIYFEKRWEKGIRWEVIIDEIIMKWGIGESTINQIIKGNGNYKNNEDESNI